MSGRRLIVLDLDGSLETPYYSEEQAPKVQAWMREHPCGYDYERLHVVIAACGEELPHFILPGTFELLRWVHDHGFEIVFFSNGVAERNKALCPILMERAFGPDAVPSYRILSREDCVDTRHVFDGERRAMYNGLWHGNYKKKLVDVVCAADELPNTLVVEDDNSYACRGEEQNFVYGVYGGCAAKYLDKPEVSERCGHDFHLPFYFCGMLKRIVSCAEKDGVSLAEASCLVQYEDYGFVFPKDGQRRKNLSGNYVNTPVPPNGEFKIYLEGLKELRRYNPGLKFWDDGDEDPNYWPYRPEKPMPVPPPPAPKAKTDMTMDEANYWLGVLREILCAVTHSNVKYIQLRCKDILTSPMGDGGRMVKFRHPPFREDGAYFDVKEVEQIVLYGYLPSRHEKDKDHLAFFVPDDRDSLYDVCGRVISRFMFDVFRLDVDWLKNEILFSGECWEIPVAKIGG